MINQFFIVLVSAAQSAIFRKDDLILKTGLKPKVIVLTFFFILWNSILIASCYFFMKIFGSLKDVSYLMILRMTLRELKVIFLYSFGISILLKMIFLILKTKLSIFDILYVSVCLSFIHPIVKILVLVLDFPLLTIFYFLYGILFIAWYNNHRLKQSFFNSVLISLVVHITILYLFVQLKRFHIL